MKNINTLFRLASIFEDKLTNKVSTDTIDQTIQNYMMNMYHLNGGRLYGMCPGAAPDYKIKISKDTINEKIYKIDIFMSLSRKNGFDSADTMVSSGTFISERNQIAIQNTKNMYNRQFKHSISKLLDDTFNINYILNIHIL
jgi:hypothetical protein